MDLRFFHCRMCKHPFHFHDANHSTIRTDTTTAGTIDVTTVNVRSALLDLMTGNSQSKTCFVSGRGRSPRLVKLRWTLRIHQASVVALCTAIILHTRLGVQPPIT